MSGIASIDENKSKDTDFDFTGSMTVGKLIKFLNALKKRGYVNNNTEIILNGGHISYVNLAFSDFLLETNAIRFDKYGKRQLAEKELLIISV